MTHGEARKRIIDKIVKGEIKPRLNRWAIRSNAPPPPNPVFRALLEVARDEYGRLYGRKSCGWKLGEWTVLASKPFER